MVVHVYHPYRQPDGINHCAAVNGHCSHLCLPAPQINDKSPKISCACPNGLMLMSDGLMCAEEGNTRIIHLTLPIRAFGREWLCLSQSLRYCLAVLFCLIIIFFSRFVTFLFLFYLNYFLVITCVFFVLFFTIFCFWLNNFTAKSDTVIPKQNKHRHYKLPNNTLLREYPSTKSVHIYNMSIFFFLCAQFLHVYIYIHTRLRWLVTYLYTFASFSPVSLII